jgi:hypothetical protein
VAGFRDATTYVENYTGGTLVFDMFDTNKQEIDLERLGDRRPLEQTRKEHKEAQQSRGENVRALCTAVGLMERLYFRTSQSGNWAREAPANFLSFLGQ